MNILENESKEINNEVIYSKNEVNNSQIFTFEKDDENDNINTIEETDVQNEELSSISNNEIVNCLSLTVKKDYSLSIAKNIMARTFKDLWKIAVSFFTLNFFKFFF